MNERFLQFIWQYQLFEKNNLLTEHGLPVEIVSPGKQNLNSGPDFIEAKIRIGDTLWVGCVEVHLNSSDWYSHKHHSDSAYNNVILHVVNQFSKEIINQNQQIIPTLVISTPQSLVLNYTLLMKSKAWIACEDVFSQIDEFRKIFYIEALSIERLQQKSEQINRLFEEADFSYDELFYRLLSQNFGFKINAQPFEQLARKTPLNIIRKIAGNPLSVEALLFGQAGLLPHDNFPDDYCRYLVEEYRHLKHRFNLDTAARFEWKFSRIRPQNFPTIRIAQLSKMVSAHSDFIGSIIESADLTSVRSLFEINPSDYWQEHYHFGKKSKRKFGGLGNASLDIILINTVVPFLFFYGLQHNNQSLKNKALQWLEAIVPEKNSIIEHWQDLGAEISNARQSQGYLQLKNEYCSKQRCLDCQIGSLIIREGLMVKE
ncbi:MAG TPA: DUF2851 family protein [Salinivirgaceae bacterium]|nr:DUF2851 family protein [Salinivirgaceae bacterium]